MNCEHFQSVKIHGFFQLGTFHRLANVPSSKSTFLTLRKSCQKPHHFPKTMKRNYGKLTGCEALSSSDTEDDYVPSAGLRKKPPTRKKKPTKKATKKAKKSAKNSKDEASSSEEPTSSEDDQSWSSESSESDDDSGVSRPVVKLIKAPRRTTRQEDSIQFMRERDFTVGQSMYLKAIAWDHPDSIDSLTRDMEDHLGNTYHSHTQSTYNLVNPHPLSTTLPLPGGPPARISEYPFLSRLEVQRNPALRAVSSTIKTERQRAWLKGLVGHAAAGPIFHQSPVLQQMITTRQMLEASRHKWRTHMHKDCVAARKGGVPVHCTVDGKFEGRYYPFFTFKAMVNGGTASQWRIKCPRLAVTHAACEHGRHNLVERCFKDGDDNKKTGASFDFPKLDVEKYHCGGCTVSAPSKSVPVHLPVQTECDGFKCEGLFQDPKERISRVVNLGRLLHTPIDTAIATVSSPYTLFMSKESRELMFPRNRDTGRLENKGGICFEEGPAPSIILPYPSQPGSGTVSVPLLNGMRLSVTLHIGMHTAMQPLLMLDIPANLAGYIMSFLYSF